MNFQNILSNVSSDSTLLSSFSDFLESKIEKAMSLTDTLSDIVSHAGEVGYAIPQINDSMSYEVDGVVVTLDPQQFAQALYDDLDEYDFIYHDRNFVVKVDEVIAQLSSSITSNRVVIEATRCLRDGPDETIASLTTLFTSRMSIKVGEFTDTISKLGASVLDILTQQGRGVGDRIRDLMGFMGFYNVPEEPNLDIGIPNSQLTEVSGTNVYQALFSEIPKGIKEFFQWLGNAVKELVHILTEMVQVVVGSSVYRAVKKVITTMTLLADSFAYNSGSEEGCTIGDYGVWNKFKLKTYDDPWLQYDLDTIHGIAKCLVASNNGDPTNMTLMQCLDYILSHIPGSAGTPLNEFWIERTNPWGPTIPSWIYDYIVTPEQFTNQVLCKCYQIYWAFAACYYNSAIQNPITIFEALSYALGAVLDALHINDNEGIAKHMESNSYLKVDLPCSTLYFWLVGSDVYYTRRVVPQSDYFGKTNLLNLIASDIGVGNGYVNFDTFMSYINACRSKSFEYASIDTDMRDGILAANIIDAAYLAVYTKWRSDGHAVTDDLPSLWSNLANNINGIVAEWFPFLTGTTYQLWMSNYGSLLNVEITNLTLTRMLGAQNSGAYFSDQNIAWDFMRFFTQDVDNDDVFIPYTHVPSIESGRYHVITDKELANVFMTVIKIAAVVAAVVFFAKIAKKLKVKATKARTIADATAWEAVSSGTYDGAAALKQYKANRLASRLEALASGAFTAISSVVKSVGTSIKNTASGIIQQVRNQLNGSSNETQDPATIAKVKHLIDGH